MTVYLSCSLTVWRSCCGHAFFGYPPMVKWRYILIHWPNVYITIHIWTQRTVIYSFNYQFWKNNWIGAQQIGSKYEDMVFIDWYTFWNSDPFTSLPPQGSPTMSSANIMDSGSYLLTPIHPWVWWICMGSRQIVGATPHPRWICCFRLLQLAHLGMATSEQCPVSV